MGLSSSGALVIGVTQSNRAIDAIWGAVEEAIDAGMTPDKFKREMVAAWDHYREQQKRHELQELSK